MDRQASSLPEAVIFDWDGVLVESLGFIKEAFLHMCKRVTPRRAVDADNLPAMSLRDYFPILFEEEAPMATKIFYDYVEENHLNALKTTDGAEELLRFLWEQSVPLFVVSNKKGGLLRKEVDYLSWTRYFRCVIGSGDFEEDKPSAVPVRHALASEGLSPSRKVWFVGDSAVDMECAENSGCSAFFMQKKGSSNLLKDMKFPVDMIISSCEDLKIKVIDNKIKV